MMSDPKYTPATLQYYRTRYIREYRAICVLWGILTIIFCILNVVCFVQPQWIGDTHTTVGYGHFGLYRYCEPSTFSFPREDFRYICHGSFADFSLILNGPFKAATFFVGISALLMLLCVAGIMLFFCFKRRWVFILCGTLQVVCAVFMFLGCVIYPSGWDHERVIDLCRHETELDVEVGKYKIGACGIRWAYILAILGIIDAAVLAALAFVLATKSAKLTDDYLLTNGMVSKSEINGYGGDTLSRRSMPIQPMVAVPDTDQADRYSEYSHKSEKSKRSAANNFQL